MFVDYYTWPVPQSWDSHLQGGSVAGDLFPDIWLTVAANRLAWRTTRDPMHTWLGHGIDQSDLKLVLYMQALRNTFDSTNSELDASALDLTRSGTTAVLSIVTSDWCATRLLFQQPTSQCSPFS